MPATRLHEVTYDRNIEAANPRKTKSCKDLGFIGISAISDDIINISQEVWESEHRNSPNYNRNGVLKDTRQITLKFSDKLKPPFTYFDMPIWEEWKSRLQPVMEKAIESYGYRNVLFPRVMFAKLPAHCSIAPHTDGGEPRSRPHKIHIPITTNDKVFFLHPPSTKYHLEVGKAYEVNNCRQHGAENLGDTDRIHFIFECIPVPELTIKLIGSTD